MNKKQVTLLAGVALGLIVGPGLAPAAVIFQDDFATLDAWTGGQHGGRFAGTDDETDGRTVFGHAGDLTGVGGLPGNGNINSSEIQVDFPAIALDDATLQSFTLDTKLRVNSTASNLIIEFRNQGGAAPDLHRLYTSVNGVGTLEFREYVYSDTISQTDDGTLASDGASDLPFNNVVSDYFTVRVNYDVPTTTWTLGTDHSGAMTTYRSIDGQLGGEVDRIRLRSAGTKDHPFSSARYFVDSVSLHTTAIPEPGTLGLLSVAGLVLAGLRRRRG